MLKKRILASSMASVMALSGVSLVAFADTKDYGEAVTKTELEAYVKSFDKFVADELDGYGTIQADYFRQAIDHANVVLGDSKAEAKDYTAAYQMIKAIKEKLVIKTNDELKALIKDNQAKYDGNNILNELYQDNIYKVSTYEKFTTAFDDAQFFVDSGDSRGITDAYLALESAVKGLEELTSITKADFRTALANYEKLEYSMRNYETWRRGTISVAPKTGVADDDEAKKIVDKKAVVKMGDLINLVYGNGKGDFAYLDGGEWKWLNFNDQLIGNWASAGDLKGEIKTVGDEFAEAKGVVKTTKPEIVDAYKAAVEAVDVFKSWTPDNYNSGSKSSCASLEKKYHNQLVEKYNYADLNTLLGVADFAAVDGEAKDATLDTTAVKLTYKASKHTLTSDKATYIVINKATGLIKANVGAISKTANFYDSYAEAQQAATTAGANFQAQTISAGTDIMKYLGYTDPVVTPLATLEQAVTDAQADVATAQDNVDTALQAIDTDSAKWVTTLSDTAVGKDDSATEYVDVFYTDANGDAQTKTIYKVKDNNVPNNATAVNDHNGLYTTAAAKIEALIAAQDTLTEKEEALGEYGISVALSDYRTYGNYKFPANAEAAKTLIDTLADGKTIAKCSGSTAEWTLIWRQLAYAFDDMFPAPVAGETITLKMLEAKIAEAYELCDKTGDAALFADPYAQVVADRQDSNAFVKEAKATTGYKDGDTLDVAGVDVATQYGALKDSVAELNKWYNDFKYSYDEVRATIAEVANAIDKGDVKGDKLTAALTACAYDLSILVPSAVTAELPADTNLAFDADRTFQPVNRLKTDKTITGAIGLSTEEKALVASYAALVKAYADAKAGDSDKGYDLSADGIVDFDDVQLLFDNFVMKGEYNAKYDFNSDKLVDFDDVQIFFEKYVMA